MRLAWITSRERRQSRRRPADTPKLAATASRHPPPPRLPRVQLAQTNVLPAALLRVRRALPPGRLCVLLCRQRGGEEVQLRIARCQHSLACRLPLHSLSAVPLHSLLNPCSSSSLLTPCSSSSSPPLFLRSHSPSAGLRLPARTSPCISTTRGSCGSWRRATTPCWCLQSTDTMVSCSCCCCCCGWHHRGDAQQWRGAYEPRCLQMRSVTFDR